LKILDPACGSGAFPMGMFNLMVHTIEKLQERKTTYKNKLDIITNCIYGVDIQNIAIEISKLRFFISLLVDYEIPVKLEDFEVLPNLETKFAVANTLIGLNLKVDELSDPELLAKCKEITEVFMPFTQAKTPKDKENIKNAFEAKKEELITLLESNNMSNDEIKKVRKWNPFNVCYTSPFFDSEIMFGIKDGFDIVIGNPPYIGESRHKYIFEQYKQSVLGKRFYIGKMDIFYFFFHIGLDLLKNSGFLTLITTNYYLTADGAVNLRKDLYERTNIIKLINFNEYKIFMSALGQHNMITQVQRIDKPKEFITQQIFVKYKGNPDTETTKTILNGTNEKSVYNTISRKDLFNGAYLYIRFASEKSNIDIVLNKMASIGIPLTNIFQTNQGVVPGAMFFTDKLAKDFPKIKAKTHTPIFIFPKGELQKINDGNQADFIKPFFKNSDIHRYVTEIKTHKELLYADGINQIPANIIAYLKKFKPILEKRRECQSGKIKWFELQWPRFEELFIRPKIVIPYRCKRATFAYNEFPFFVSTDVYLITEKTDNRMHLKVLLGILNSTLINTWLYNRGKRKGEMLELFPTALQHIPIIMPTDIKYFVFLVDQILAAKAANPKADTSGLEARIDKMVYQLYGLTEEEITAVEEK
jgi:adenine-specific DNA-methyltransferase